MHYLKHGTLIGNQCFLNLVVTPLRLQHNVHAMSTSTDALGSVWATIGSLSYRGLSLLALPSYVASLAAEAFSGQQASASAFEKLGITGAKRPSGPVLWFHALSIGESAVALPVIFRCLLEYNEHVHVLLTTCTQEAHSLLHNSLPPRVTVQYLPPDNVVCMQQFIAHWRPQTCILMESPTWPALVECCAAAGVRLALLNARLSSKVFLGWFSSLPKRALLGSMLSRFSLIVPQSDIDVGRFRILGATLGQMPGWCSDLKYAAALGTSVWHLWRPRPARIAALRHAVSARPLWVAAHTAAGEEEVIGGCHVKLKADWPGLITVVVPRTAARCREVATVLEELSLKVALWSQVVDVIAPAAAAAAPQSSSSSGSSNKGGAWLPTIFASKGDSSKSNSGRTQPAAGSSRAAAGDLVPSAAAAAAAATEMEAATAALKGVDVLLVDVLSDLPLMYSVAEIAFVGNSLLEGCGGHNLAEAAVAGCAIVIGEHAGHFNTMADELNQAAVIAAEEASAAVNSSGPLEDPFGYPGHNSGGGTTDAATAAAAVPQLEGGEEPSPRDGSHWRGILEPQQQQQQQLREASSSSTIAHLQQQGSRPSTAPAAMAYSQEGSSSSRQQQQQLDSVGSSGNSAPLNSFASEQATAAGSGSHSSSSAAVSGRRNDGTSTARAAAAAAASSAAPATTPATVQGSGSSNARHAHAWAAYAATLGDQMTVGGVLSVLGEETGVLLDGPSLSLPNGSCHIYDNAREPVAPPPSAANSTPFGGTGEVTPEGSSGGGTASAERQERQMQQLDGYFNRVMGSAAAATRQQQQQQQQQQQVYLEPSLTSQDSTGDGSSQQPQQQQHMLLRQQQRQQILRRRAMAGAPSSSNSSTDGSGLLLQQQHAVDGVLHQGLLVSPCSPHCPMTPNTPYPTPDDSAQTFGGRSPLSPYQLEGSVELPPMQLNQAQLSTAQQQLLSQRICRCSWGSGGGAPESGRSTVDGAAAEAAAGAAVAAVGAAVEVLADGVGESSALAGDKAGSVMCCNCCCHAAEQQQCGSSSSCEVHMASRPETPQGAAAAAAGAGESPVGSLVIDAESIPAEELPGMLAPALLLGEDEQQQQQQCKGSLLQPEQQQQQHSAGHTVPQLQPGSAGFVLPHNALARSEQYEVEAAAEEAAAAELMQRCSYRPSNPAPPDCSSPLAGGSCSSPVVTPRAAAAEVGTGSSSGNSHRVLTMRRSYAGPSSSGSSSNSNSSRYMRAGGWRGGSTGGEPMTSSSPEAGVIHEVGAATEAVVSAELTTSGGAGGVAGGGVAAAAGSSFIDAVTDAVAEPTGPDLLSPFTNGISVEESAWGSGSAAEIETSVEGGMQSSSAVRDDSAGGHVRMGRSPTICELVRCDESCASSMTAAGGGGGDGAAPGDSETAAAQPGIDLFPGASRAASGQAAAVEAGVSGAQLQLQQGGSCEHGLAEQGSMGWEQWGQQQQQQQQCNGHAQCSGSSSSCTSGSGQSAAAAAVQEMPATNSSSAFAAASGVAAAAAAVTFGASSGCSNSVFAVTPAVSSSGVSRLGDPSRSTHYMDLAAQSPNMRINLPQRSTSADSDCLYMANPQSSSAASTSSTSYYQQHSMSAAPSGMSGYSSAAPARRVAMYGPAGDSGGAAPGSGNSSRAAVVAAADGPSGWAQQQQQQGMYSTAAGYFYDAGSSMSLQQLELGGATPSSVASGFSPTSTATSLAATPMFNNAWSSQQQQQQQLMPPTAAAAAAARLARRGSRGHSTMSALSNASTLSNMSSLDGGMSRDERQHSVDGAAWGRLSGLDTPGAGRSQCGSEAQTPHGFRTPTHRAGADAGSGEHGAMPGTSYLRYRGDYILPATHLPYAPHGPAVWRVAGAEGLAAAVGTLLREPLERRSRGHAATQAAAKLASGLVSTVWHVVDDVVVAPALQEYVASHGTPGAAAAQAARAPTRVLGYSAARS